MFRYSLTPQVTIALGELDALRSVPVCPRPVSERYAGRLRREVEAGAVAGSVSIEGVSVTAADALCVLAGSPPSRVSARECALIDAYREAYSWTLLHAAEPLFVWRERFVLDIHRRLMACDRDRPGATGYRTTQVYLGDPEWGGLHFKPPPRELVPGLIRELSAWLAGHGEHPAVAAALAHVRLAGIHPFIDGNGRLARILTAAVMVQGGFAAPEFLGLEEWWGAHRREYYRAFGALGSVWNPDADVTGFVEAHVSAQLAHTVGARDAVRTECAIFGALQQVVAAHAGLEARSAEALHDAVLGRSMTVPLYRAFTGVTEMEARRDLARIEGEGLLISCDGSGERYFVRTRALLDELAEHAGATDSEDDDRSVSVDDYAVRIILRIAAEGEA